MKKTIINFLELEKWEEKYVKDKLTKYPNLVSNFSTKPLNKKLLTSIKDSDILAIFIYSNITKDILDRLPKLKFITTMSTGFDHIDLDECKKRKIAVSNVPFYSENTVAEHTMALLLSLSRKIPLSIDKTRRYDFTLDNLRGFDLKGKTLGLIGFGHIGQHVARMAKGFEMNIIVYDPKPNKNLEKKFNIKYVKFDELLSKSDVISLHAPYNESTHHLINKDNIKLIKKRACLINTARGGLVETDALMTALDKKIISCAGLDVLEEESFIREEKELLSKSFQKNTDLKTVLQGHMLIQDPRVLVTPHNAFNSTEALNRILDTTINNIDKFLNKKPVNLV